MADLTAAASSGTTPAEPTPPAPLNELQAALWRDHGVVYLTGTQALLRALRMQREADAQAGLDTRGFLSGYRGSPLGAVDQAVWKAGQRFTDAGIRFLPAINEELAATAVLGTQRVESDPQKTCDAVFAMWYGKGPGVDRAADALKHGNAYGSSPHGGVVVVAGDDHGCVSSSMPHQSEQAMQSFGMPVVAPADISDLIEFSLYAWRLSRYAGCWVGLTALSEVVEGAATVDIDRILARQAAWIDAAGVRAATGHAAPPDGLHYRWPDLPSLRIESRLADKHAAVHAFSQVNSIDRTLVRAEGARVGILTCGKAHADLMEVLRRLAITPAMLDAAGVRLRKIGLSFPLDQHGLRQFTAGLSEVLVIEEKGAVVETQMRSIFYNDPVDQRPRILGKQDAQGRPLVSALGELRPSRLIELVAAWLARQHASLDAREQVRDFTPAPVLSNVADAVKRLPYFCAGCPHNTSTRVPEGSSARAGIGCHFMANWMERDTVGLIQMGGEGVDWVSHAMFTKAPHVFQNLGDGTYYHSGYLAIRQAVAAGANITYKILFNDAVAMTGGQPVDGVISVDAIARQVESEGVKAVAVLSDDIGKYEGLRDRFPKLTTFDDRHALDDVQRRLREVPGVTVLIYEQTCAAEKRRRRKKGELPDPARRLFIHEGVCEGCGDCGVQSNCVAVLPKETPDGRKRQIDQSACNKDWRCADGFCPSFVAVEGGQLKKPAARPGHAAMLRERAAALPQPAPREWNGPYDLLVTGVGGTGVVTVGALIAMAAHLEGCRASVLDFMGFAQKGGSVMSFVRWADRPERLNQVRIDAQQADAVLACDMVVAAQPEALQTVRHGRTRILASTHLQPVADLVRHPDGEMHGPALLDKLRHAAGPDRVETFDAQALALDHLGDTIAANIVALGAAWQRGLVPVGMAALEKAVELNGVAVQANLAALAVGRLAMADPAALASPQNVASAAPVEEALPALLERARRELTIYQDAAYAARFAQRIDRLRAAEQALPGHDPKLPLTHAAARSLLKLMRIKDEYEVARMLTDPAFEQGLRARFDGEVRLAYHLAPPSFAKPQADGKPPRKRIYGPWMGRAMGLLKHFKGLRGTALDPFGYHQERKMERSLIERFEARIEELARGLTSADRLPLAIAIARVPLSIRGYGHIKLASLALAQAREAELLHRWDPALHPRPKRTMQAGQLRGIPVTTANAPL